MSTADVDFHRQLAQATYKHWATCGSCGAQWHCEKFGRNYWTCCARCLEIRCTDVRAEVRA